SGTSGALSSRAPIEDAFDLAADDKHYSQLRGSLTTIVWQGGETMRERCHSRLKLSAVLAGLFSAAFLVPSARGEEPRLSISGYDPVAYFTDGKPTQGKAEIEYLWHKLAWRFASEAHREMFTKNPDHYAPQYDGYCAMGVSNDDAAHKDTVDPEAWAIVDGKLYLVHNQYWLGVWRGKPEGKKKRSKSRWERPCGPRGTGNFSTPSPPSPPPTHESV